MGPAQPLIDTDPNCKSTPKVVPEKGKCKSGWEATLSEMEAMLDGQSKAAGGTEDVEVDVTGCANIIDTKLTEAEDPDATEYSSSFGDTVSGNEKYPGLSEAEVESEYRDHNGLDSPFDSFGLMFQTRYAFFFSCNCTFYFCFVSVRKPYFSRKHPYYLLGCC